MKQRSLAGWVLAAVVVLLVLPAASPALQAQGGSIGLDVALGAASFHRGFYVNIHLIYTFQLTPTAELYKLGGRNPTDMAIAFKLILPLSRLDLYAGVVPGLTAVGDLTAAHVGLLGGASFPLVSNLDLFVQGRYKWLFQGESYIRVLNANPGILFNF